MGNILFGYRNHVFEATGGISSLDEAGDFVDDNVAKPHPALFWRADDLTKSVLGLDLGAPPPGITQLVALICSTAGNRRNLLAYSDALDQLAAWARTNAAPSFINSPVSPFVGASTWHTVSFGAGSIQHYIDQSRDLARTTTKLLSPSVQHSAVIAAKQSQGGAHVRLEIAWNNRAETASITVNLSTGATQATAASANVTIDSSAVVDKGNGWYEIRLVATAAMATATSAWKMGYRVYVLDSAFADTYTIGSPAESIYLSGPKQTFGALDNVFERTEADPGARWVYKAQNAALAVPTTTGTFEIDSGWRPLAMSADLETWADARAWAHSWYLLPTADQQNWESHQIEVWCDDASGQTDLSAVYIGPIFQPTRNLDFDFKIVPTTANPPSFAAPGGQEFRGATTGPRMWEISLKYQRESEALGDFHALGIKLQRDQPLLVILDPDETAYGQEKVIYGFLESLEIGPVTYDATLATLVYNVRIAVLEVLR